MSVADTAWEIKRKISVMVFISGEERTSQGFPSTVVSSAKDRTSAAYCRTSQLTAPTNSLLIVGRHQSAGSVLPQQCSVFSLMLFCTSSGLYK